VDEVKLAVRTDGGIETDFVRETEAEVDMLIATGGAPPDVEPKVGRRGAEELVWREGAEELAPVLVEDVVLAADGARSEDVGVVPDWNDLDLLLLDLLSSPFDRKLSPLVALLASPARPSSLALTC
jgi:hypothetical protein